MARKLNYLRAMANLSEMFHDTFIASLVEVDDQLIAFDGFDTAGAKFPVNTRSPTEKGAGG
jgi:hypothetical protein